jgi:hypothetical protein
VFTEKTFKKVNIEGQTMNLKCTKNEDCKTMNKIENESRPSQSSPFYHQQTVLQHKI